MSSPFPIVIDGPADLWSGLDALLAYVEEHERDRLNGAIRRLANVRAVLFGPAAPEAQPATRPPLTESLQAIAESTEAPPGKPSPAATADPAAPQAEPGGRGANGPGDEEPGRAARAARGGAAEGEGPGGRARARRGERGPDRPVLPGVVREGGPHEPPLPVHADGGREEGTWREWLGAWAEHGYELTPDTEPGAIAADQRAAVAEALARLGAAASDGAVSDATDLPVGVVRKRRAELTEPGRTEAL